MTYILPSLRIWVATLAICVIGYVLLILGFAQIFAPHQAQGSIVDVDGRAVGSELVAQGFSSPEYFWPRPSAVDHDGAGAGGSNWSPTSPDLAARAEETVARYGATEASPLPADLVAASGGGLDPHITLEGALYQVERVAGARGLQEDEVGRLVERMAESAGGPFAPDRIVNVLALNMALDEATR